MSWFEHKLQRALTRNIDERTIKEYPELFLQREASVPEPIANALWVIDAKASGLLTHVSMMIAGLGLIAPMVVTHDFEEGVIIAEIGVYIFIAIGCLRCLSVFHPRDLSVTDDEFREKIGRELMISRELYRLCSQASIIFTIIVFVTLPLLYLI